jgi:hypothetical protein
MHVTSEYLLETIDRAMPLLKAISDDDACEKEAPGKWCYKEIIGHLIDSAANNHQKFIRCMLEEEVHFPGYQQDFWVALQQYHSQPWEELLQLWQSYNMHLSNLMQCIPFELGGNVIYIDEKGPFTLEFVVKDYLEHLKHHLLAILPGQDFLQNGFRMIY